jgi:hypothetical protein
MVHHIILNVDLISFLVVRAVVIMVKNAASEIFVRISPLVLVFADVIVAARVLRNQGQLRLVVSNHAVGHIPVVHRVAVTQIRRHWELVTSVVNQVSIIHGRISHLLVVGLLLLHMVHDASLLPSELILRLV